MPGPSIIDIAPLDASADAASRCSIREAAATLQSVLAVLDANRASVAAAYVSQAIDAIDDGRE